LALPDPEAEAVATVIQLTLLFAVHVLAVEGAVNETVLLPPLAPIVAEVEFSEKLVEFCATWNGNPAIVKAPVRAAPVLALSEYDTCPFPVPEVPVVTVIQEAPLVAVQEQPEAAITLIV
jgi:hypothetical protein